jgi:Uma2 family endonuclease
MMVLKERLYTADDLWALSHSAEYDEMRLELREGELIVMPPAGIQHGGYASKMDRLIGNFSDQHNLGMTFAAETGFILFTDESGKDTVRAPDVGFVSAARLPEKLPETGYAPFPPDLAVEVVSPNDSADDVQDKVRDYLRAGVRLIWVFYPRSKTVNVHSATGTTTVGIDGVLDGEDVLPGFTLRLGDFFG